MLSQIVSDFFQIVSDFLGGGGREIAGVCLAGMQYLVTTGC